MPKSLVIIIVVAVPAIPPAGRGRQSGETAAPPTPGPVITTAPATPAAAPAPGRIQLPTPAPTPPGPTPTIAPSAQTTIMRHLNRNLCAVITQDELFQITGPRLFPGGNHLQLENVPRPDDLAGLENLEYLRYRGMLDYLDFTPTPALHCIELWEPVENRPDNFSLTVAPMVEHFSGEFRGPAARQLLEIETLHRVFSNVIDWPDNPNDNTGPIRLELVLPATESPVAPYQSNAYDNWRREMPTAINDELVLLAAARAAADAAVMDNYGPAPRKTFRDIYGDPDTADVELAGYRVEQTRPRLGNRIEITADINPPAGQ